MTDRQLAETLLAALAKDEVDDTDMQEAESAILERLDVSLDETELGLTRKAVEQIEQFVSTHTGTPWTYQDAGFLGTDAETVR